MIRRRILVTVLIAAGSVWGQDPDHGFPPFGSFEPGRFDAVNRQNLNVNVAIPVVSAPARGGNFSFSIVNDSLIWKLETVGTATLWVPIKDELGNPTWGWKKDFGATGSVPYSKTTVACWVYGPPPRYLKQTVYRYRYKDYAYVDPSGTNHKFAADFIDAGDANCGPLANNPRTGYATDSSGTYLDANSPTQPKVTISDGTKFDGLLKDRNGNFISKTVVSSTETHWTDTVGRVALKVIKPSNTTAEYHVLNQTGGYTLITMTLTSLSVKTNFGCSGVGEYTSSGYFPTQIEFSNNQVFTFEYEETPQFPGNYTGRLKKVTLPTGASYEYIYPATPNNGVTCTDGTVVNLTRKVTADSTTRTWTFTRTQVGSNWDTAIDAPPQPYDSVGNRSVYAFGPSGEILSEKIYQGTSTLLRTVNTMWAANGTPASRTVILGTKQSKVETTFDDFANLTQLVEYDWGDGAPATNPTRTTQITYETDTAYTSRNIRNLAKLALVREGGAAGTVKSRTEIAYDETAYLHTLDPASDCPLGIPQHDDSAFGCNFYTRGNPTTVTTYENADAQTGAVQRHTHYDFFGNVRRADVNCCQQKEFIYSAAHAYAYASQLKRGPAGSQLTANFSYNSYTGQVASATDPNNKAMGFAYDTATRRLVTVTRPDNATVDYTYNDAERWTKVDSPLDGTHKLSQKTYFNQLGQAFKRDLTSTAPGQDCSATQVEFDLQGRAHKRSNPFACGGSPFSWTSSVFDALGRILSVTAPAPDSAVTSYSYSNNTVTVTDPAGKQRKSETDGLGRLIKVSEPDVTNPGELNVDTTYAYSVLDLLTTVSQGVQTRSYVYDDMGRLTSQTTPEAGQWTYQYNAFNLVERRIDARGVDSIYTYDGLNRLKTVSYDVTGTTVPATATVEYFYDEGGAAANAMWRLTRVTVGGINDATLSYNQLGQITQVQKLIAGTTYTITYEYNLAGELKKIVYPSGRAVEQAYDSLGRLNSVFAGTTQYVNTFTYDAATWAVGNFKYGNNAVDATFSYSADRLQLTGLSYKKNGDANPFFSLGYWYKQDATNCPYGATGNNGQIQCIKDLSDQTLSPGAAGRSLTYTYDALHRLKTAETEGSPQYPKWGLSWIYDRYGNRDEQVVTHGTAPPHNPAIEPNMNRIVEDANHAYDTNGNMTKDGVNTLAYDAENRVASAAGATYTYDGAGLRVKKVWNGTTTVYVFSGSKAIAEYENGAAVGSPTREYIYSGSRLVATHEGGALKYNYHDHLSVRVTSDSSGNNRSEQGHYPFGERWYPTGDAASKLEFVSYERDEETGNDYAVFRYYANRQGRFLSPDPIAGGIANPQSLNRYSYSNNDPVNLIDPLGLTEWCFGYHVYYITVYFEAGGGIESIEVEYGGFIPVYCWDDSIQGDTDDGGGGDGALDALRAAAREVANLARRELSEECARDLEALGLTPEDLLVAAMDAQFINGVGSQVPLSTVYASSPNPLVARNAPFITGTIGDRLAQPGTVALAELNGTNIYVNPSLINPSDPYETLGTAFHEIIHNATGLTDPDIQRALALEESPTTSNISRTLLADCFGGR